MKYVRLWLAEKAMYLLKYETNWRGRWQYAQGGTYQRIDGQSLDESIRDVWQLYDLNGHTPSLVVSGPDVLWQPVSLVAESREKAREVLTFGEAAHQRLQGYAFDVQRSADDGQWYVGAYDKIARDKVQQAIDAMGIPLALIDVFPALVGRWCGPVTGWVYIPDGSVYHQVQLRKGIPWSYTLSQAVPQDDILSFGTVPWQDEEKRWSTCTGRQEAVAAMERWGLGLPEGLLVAL